MERHFAALIIITLFPLIFYGQEKQTTRLDSSRSIISTEKQHLLQNVDIIANMNYNFRSDFLNDEFLGSKFRFEQFRLEIKGYVSDKVYFRFRHRYTSSFEPQEMDKIIKGVDFAYIRVDLSDRSQLMIGKMYADWGGWEFDLNPIVIYEYSDIIEYADNFLSGISFYHQATKDHGFSIQVLNSRTADFETLYDTVPDVTASKVPLAGVVNWRGSFFEGKVKTLWSYSLFSEAQDVFKNYVALGTQYDSDKFYMAYDYKISSEDLDRTGIISDEIPDNLYNYSVRNTLYQSHWTRITYKFSDKWHISLDAFIDLADWNDDLDPMKTEDRFRTVYSYIPTIEYFPWEKIDLKFFAGVVQRHFVYSDYAKNRPGLELRDHDKTRIMVGFISPLLIL